jgi:predicted RNA-binding protein YlxR (DUF448 family)
VASKQELIRLAVDRDEPRKTRYIVLDRGGSLQGRGAYLCRASGADLPVRDCLRLATRRGALARTLRANVPIAPELVESLTGA